MKEYRYLLAVDPSLTCSGWALFSIPHGEVTAVGKIKGLRPPIPLAHRFERLQSHIAGLFEKLALGSEDILVCEAPTTAKDPHNAFKVEQVRSLFETLARSHGVRVPGRINPRSVQFEVMGLRGKQIGRSEVKSAAVRTAHYLYAARLRELGLISSEEDLMRHQDIVDAVLVGRLALIRIQGAISGQLSLETLFEVRRSQSRGSWRVRSCGVS